MKHLRKIKNNHIYSSIKNTTKDIKALYSKNYKKLKTKINGKASCVN